MTMTWNDLDDKTVEPYIARVRGPDIPHDVGNFDNFDNFIQISLSTLSLSPLLLPSISLSLN